MTGGAAPLRLTGESLTIAGLASAAATGGRIELDGRALERMARTRAVIERAIRDGVPMYGVTTGLGTRVTQTLNAEELAAFSLQTLRGRAQAVGEALPVEVVRGAMIVRANGLLIGAAGASPALAHYLAACINADLTPLVGSIGSIGTSDLLLGAVLGCALAGQGRMVDRAGTVRPADAALRAAGLEPLVPAPRDGLALCGHDGLSTSMAALAMERARAVRSALQAAAALSLEAFRANLTPLRAEALALRPQPAEEAVAAELRRLLAGSALLSPGAARRLQDPLSLRNVVQVHAALVATLQDSAGLVEMEMNGATDNPAVLLDSGEVVSTGNYHNPQLTLAVERVARALLFTASLQAARIAKLLAARFSDLPMYLARPGADSNGFAPHLKLAESLLARIHAAAEPVPLWPSISADGVEDALTNALLAAEKLRAAVDDSCRLAALELAVAAQAIELRGLEGELPAALRLVKAFVRRHVAPLHQDRPMGEELSQLADALGGGELSIVLARAGGVEASGER